MDGKDGQVFASRSPWPYAERTFVWYPAYDLSTKLTYENMRVIVLLTGTTST